LFKVFREWEEGGKIGGSVGEGKKSGGPLIDVKTLTDARGKRK